MGLGVEACVAALSDPHVRDLVRAEIERGISGWEDVAADPGWSGITIQFAASRPEWAGTSLAELADEMQADPAELAFDALVADRLDVSVVIDCMSEPDVETIMAVPWIAVCTDAEGRRPGHPILDAGRPHPRTYGSTARVLGSYARERGLVSLELAVAKLTSVPAGRLGLRERGVLREGAFADLVVFDADTVAEEATYEEPARYPAGIEHVIVNGRPAILSGAETGERPGRLLRHS
jgi:N-acyl-D-aspartate/D-glutamate deacylase